MTDSRDMHQGATDSNENYDVDFLHNIIDQLDSTTSTARSHTTEGAHPDVVSFAHSIMLEHTRHISQALSLVRDMGLGASPSGEVTYGRRPITAGYGMNSKALAFESGYYESRAAMTAASVNDLPDSAFAYIEPGGSKDASGKTTPRSLRHFPIHDAAHVRNALARAPQSPFGKKAMPRILAAAKKFGIETSQTNSRQPGAEVFRSAPFDVQQSSDGLTLEGYAAVFDQPTRISDFSGEFEEIISPGAFKRSLDTKMPVLMFEHGRHPLLGSMPLGVIERAEEDSTGLHITARLSDNWLIQPVRDAVRDRAVTGMSFRFSVPDGGDSWTTRRDDVDLRTISEARVSELGPVVFPAYEPTTAQIRSLAEHIDLTGRPVTRSPGGGDSGARSRRGPALSEVQTAAGDRDRLLALRLRGVI